MATIQLEMDKTLGIFTMAKYNVDEVLDIIKTFNPEEKKDLQNRLASVLEQTFPLPSQTKESQSQSFGGFAFGGSGNSTALGINQQMGGESNFNQTNTSTKASLQNVDLQEALVILDKLKQDIASSPALNSVQKATVDVPLKIIEEEANKPKPDKNTINQSIDSLKKGLEETVGLAEPLVKLASLLAKVCLL